MHHLRTRGGVRDGEKPRCADGDRLRVHDRASARRRQGIGAISCPSFPQNRSLVKEQVGFSARRRVTTTWPELA